MILQALKEKMGDCKFTESSLCEHKSPYHQIAEKLFYIYDADDRQPVKIVLDGDYQLTIYNESESEICVVKTDKCLIKEVEGQKKCDCILFNNRRLYFVEIKSGGTGKRGERKRKAKEQLGSTIDNLRNNGISLSNLELQAIICIKNHSRKIPQVTEQTMMEKFREQYNVKLEITDTIEF